MRLSVPHLGHLDLRTMSRKISPEFVFGPKTNQRTPYLGMKHSPEFTRPPLKCIVVNIIESLEKRADPIAMIDEQTSPSDLNTRLEAFFETVDRKKSNRRAK